MNNNNFIMTSIPIEDLTNLINIAVENAILKLKVPADQPPSSPSDDFISFNDVKNMLKCSAVTLHAYKKQGKIPFHRIGRRVLFRKNEILDCLKTINGEVIK